MKAATDNPKRNILLIQRDGERARTLQRMLRGDAGHIVHHTSLARARDWLQTHTADLALLDLDLPDAQGLEGLSSLRGEAPDLAVVVLGHDHDTSYAVDAIREGAQDYVVPGECPSSQLERLVQYAVERKAAERRLTYLAHYDPLTDVANRSLFHERLERALTRASRQGVGPAVLFLDLDGFKPVNDNLGHDAGDELLGGVALRLTECVRASDTVARLGGDEFAILLEDATSFHAVIAVAEKILHEIARPFRVKGQDVNVTTSVGIAMYPQGGKTGDALTRNADTALYRAKDMGRNGYQIFTDGMQSEMLRRLNLERDLRRALAREEFQLHFQPVVDVESGNMVSAEALLRWYPGHGDTLILPEDFIPLAEETGLITAIGEWVLYQTCAQIVSWRRADLPPLRIAVNISPRQFRQPGLARMIRRVLEDARVDASQIQLELTETMVMEDTLESSYMLNELKATGLHIAIDDFGTGYSSLSYLRSLPVDALKIDRSFIRDVAKDDDDAAITSAIIAMGQRLKKIVVAEGVETREQLQFLRREGCDRVQGFVYSEPLAADRFAELLRGPRQLALAV